jgi:hypothetical protein
MIPIVGEAMVVVLSDVPVSITRVGGSPFCRMKSQALWMHRGWKYLLPTCAFAMPDKRTGT